MHDADRPDAIDGCRVYDPDADHAFPQERLDATLEAVADDDEIAAYLEAQNVNPVSRKGYNDHGPKHVATRCCRTATRSSPNTRT